MNGCAISGHQFCFYFGTPYLEFALPLLSACYSANVERAIPAFTFMIFISLFHLSAQCWLVQVWKERCQFQMGLRRILKGFWNISVCFYSSHLTGDCAIWNQLSSGRCQQRTFQLYSHRNNNFRVPKKTVVWFKRFTISIAL